MKRSIVIAALLAASCSCGSEKPAPAPVAAAPTLAPLTATAKPETAVANKPVAETPVPPSGPTTSTPFDLSWSSIPSSFSPDDFDRVFAANATGPKGEFETEAQYRTRFPVDTTKAYSFLIATDVYRYEPERQQFKTTPSMLIESKEVDDELGGRIDAVWVTVREEEQEGRSLGTNAFGVKVAVSKLTRQKQAVAIAMFTGKRAKNAMYSLESHAYKVSSVTIPMRAEEARASKADLAVLAVARLKRGQSGRVAITLKYELDATLSTLTEVSETIRMLSADDVHLVFFNRATGKILMKRKL